MNYFNATIYGIVQGLTEFLPISSSGHLVVLHEFLAIPVENELAFDVLLHFATLLAVLYFFRKEVYLLIYSWFKSFAGVKTRESRLAWFIFIATIPAALVGYFFGSFIEISLRSPIIVAVMLFVIGIMFIIIEKVSELNIDYKNITFSKAILIGLAQVIALIPGTSRSGITIIAGMSTGLKRADAIKFSFLLSIPIIFGASLTKVPLVLSYLTKVTDELFIILIAFIFSFLSGFLAIKYFLKYAEKHTLNVFAIYRFILAVIVLVFFVF